MSSWLRRLFRFGSPPESDDRNSDDQGCTAHHYGEYSSVDEFRANLIKEYRCFDIPSNVWKEGEWVSSDPSALFRDVRRHEVDRRRRLVIKRKERATCEHHNCHETTSQWTKYDDEVLGEEIVTEERGDSS